MAQSLGFGRAIACACACVALAACQQSAANMAAKQPERKDLSMVKPGAPRAVLIANLGAPQMYTVQEGTGEYRSRSDIFNFVNGYSGGARTARVLWHSTMGVLTLGLSEPLAQAVEGYARGDNISILVDYDEHDLLKTCRVLQGWDDVGSELEPHCTEGIGTQLPDPRLVGQEQPSKTDRSFGPDDEPIVSGE